MTHVVSANGIDFLNFIGERHCLINDELKKVMGSGFSRQQLKLSIDSVTPSRNNYKSNLCTNELQ